MLCYVVYAFLYIHYKLKPILYLHIYSHLMQKMMKMILFLVFLGFTGASQQSFEVLNLHEHSTSSSQKDAPFAVLVSNENLNEVSSSVLTAENWLKTHVLTYYPSTKITTIVVGDNSNNMYSNVVCDRKYYWGLIFPSVKNLYHSLTRWGLEKDVKVSIFLRLDCLDSDPSTVGHHDLGQDVVKPLLMFLKSVNSTYSILVDHDVGVGVGVGVDRVKFLSRHVDFVKKIGSFEFAKANVIVKPKPMSRTRKLVSVVLDSKVVNPYPARPSPLPEISPLHSSVGYSVPANVAKKPLPPQSSTAAPPPLPLLPSAPQASQPPYTNPENPPYGGDPLPFAPELSPPPFTNPANPPSGYTLPFTPELSPPPYVSNPAYPPSVYTLPPCNPSYQGSGGAPFAAPEPVPPKSGGIEEMWCVAKPSVPMETLQDAMDYACGAGGADCEEIMPHGNCYFPDSIVSHASFAFNSYWQKHKKNGGTCDFGATAMLIASDPSFQHCRFVLE